MQIQKPLTIRPFAEWLAIGTSLVAPVWELDAYLRSHVWHWRLVVTEINPRGIPFRRIHVCVCVCVCVKL